VGLRTSSVCDAGSANNPSTSLKVTVPKDIVKILGIKKGDSLVWYFDSVKTKKIVTVGKM